METVSARRTRAKQLAGALSESNFIDGKLVEFDRENCFDVIDPFSQDVIGCCPGTRPEDVRSIVHSATVAQQRWAAIRAIERSKMLRAAVAKLSSVSEELAELISLETGRPIRTETRPEVENAINILNYFSGLTVELKGETVPFAEKVLCLTLREPLGVVAAIVPWNVPAMLTALKIGPALAAGNSIVVKSSEKSPLSTLFLCKVLGENLPQGVLQSISGFGDVTGAALVRDAGVAKIAFTGSVRTGKAIYATAADRIIPVTLELGGKSPLIVMADASVEKAVQLAIVGMRFSRQGQSCTSTTRIYVHESLRLTFLIRLKEEVAKMKFGDPLDEETAIGTVISIREKIRIEMIVAAEGARAIPLANLDTGSAFPNAAYTLPVAIVSPDSSSSIVQEEIFGPVVVIDYWTDLDQVAEQANSTQFGLSACVLTDSIQVGLTFARKLKAGYVQVNSGLVIQPGISFGGYKSSGIGREASLESMVEAYTQSKTVLIDHS